MDAKMTPVDVAAAAFGGLSKVAPAVGQHRTRGWHWKKGKGVSRPAGDFPSLKVVRDVRAAAAARGIDLPVAWLVYGAPEAEVSALLAAAQTQVAAE